MQFHKILQGVTVLSLFVISLVLTLMETIENFPSGTFLIGKFQHTSAMFLSLINNLTHFIQTWVNFLISLCLNVSIFGNILHGCLHPRDGHKCHLNIIIFNKSCQRMIDLFKTNRYTSASSKQTYAYILKWCGFNYFHQSEMKLIRTARSGCCGEVNGLSVKLYILLQ